jgi:hypothetical protein
MNKNITPDMLATVLQLMENGATPTQVCAALRISRKTLGTYLNNPEFEEAFEVGKVLFEAKFETYGQDLMLGKIPNGKESTWFRFMQRYGGWADKTENKQETQITLRDDELNAQIDRLLSNRNENNDS